MFRTAAKKIAHNSTIPVLGVNKDLRTLQELITAEKSVLNSLQRLSADLVKASEALKAWGIGEGDDLGDVLTASCTLFLHFAEALANYANHEIPVREHMKSIRTREERLDDLRRRRKSLHSDADSAEKKLGKMSPDNKNLQVQTDLLNKLRDEIHIMDADIMAEEASLGDYKRTSAKAWMGLKFGGLAECSEKGVIIGEFGKMLVAEIPLDTTEPGLPRSVYQGHSNTEALVADARRALTNVVFSHEPNPNRLPNLRYSPELPGIPFAHRHSQLSYGGDTSRRTSMSPSSISMPMPSTDETSRLSQILRSPTTQFPQPSLYPPPRQQSLSYEQLQSPTPPPGSEAAEFGVLPDPFSPSTGPQGGRFATFPVKAVGPRPPPPRSSQLYGTHGAGVDRPPSLDLDRPSDSFSSSVADALGQEFEFEKGGLKSSSSGAGPVDEKRGSMSSQRRSYSPPPPQYSAVFGPQEFESLNRKGNHNSQLAYMANPDEEEEGLQSTEGRDDRRVTFEELREPEAEESKAESDAAVSSRAEQDASEEAMQRSDASHSNVSAEATRAAPPQSTPPQPESVAARPSTGSEQPTYTIPEVSSRPREPSPPLDGEKALNAAAAREVSRELDALMFSVSPQPQPQPSAADAPPADRTPSPLQPPRVPFGARSVSPRPNIEISTSQPGSPRLGPQYVRARDRSLASPSSISSASNGDQGTIPPVTTSSRFSADRGPASPTAPSISIARGTPSPAPSGMSSGTPFRTPPELPGASFYSLSSAVTGSGTSFASGGGKISAAAFRRQQMRSPSMPTLDPPSSADTGPLVVKKRPLPQSPSAQASGWSAQNAGAIPRVPSAGRRISQSPTRHEGAGSEDEYDYVSAYANETENGSGRGDGGYAQGKFATNLEDGSGLR